MISIQCNRSNINLDVIANSGQCFRWKQLDSYTLQRLAYKIYILNDEINIYQTENELIFECDENEFLKWYEYLDLNTTYDIPYSDLKDDKFIQSAIKYGKGMRILNQNLWETLVSFILSQNSNIPKIKKCIDNLIEAYGRFPSDVDILNNPEKVTHINAGYRDKYLINAAHRYKDIESTINSKHLSYIEYINVLKNINGVGDKVANCVALFGSHYLEACPIDVWMKRIIDEQYNDTIPNWMSSKYAGYLQQLAFYYRRSINYKSL